MEYTLVEKMLPARVLLNIGIYLQTAAHLELAVWQIVMIAENINPEDLNQLKSSIEIKKVTRKLVSNLKSASCSKNVPASIGIRIAALASKIEAGLENRNLAAHGAFFTSGTFENIRVSHYFTRGHKGEKQWFETSETITSRQIREAIFEIDTLLREAINIRETLKSKQPSA